MRGPLVSAVAVAKKPEKKDSPKPPPLTRQVNVRFPEDIAERLEDAAAMLGVDSSNLLRMIVIENLPIYEERGRKARNIS
jgi:hypothetical protein